MSKSGPHFPQIATGGSWGARVQWCPKTWKLRKTFAFDSINTTPPSPVFPLVVVKQSEMLVGGALF